MKFISKAGFIISLMLFGSMMPSLSAQDMTPPAEAAAEAIQNFVSDHVVATIAGEDFTIADLDAYVAIVSPGQPDTLGQRRLQTLRALVNLRAIAEAAAAQGLGETAEFKLRAELMRQSALQEAYINTELAGKISEADVKARYEQEIAASVREEEVRARHILVDNEDEAKEIISRLDKGEAFEAIAEEKSTDSSSSLGGDIGYFTKGQMVSEFEEAAFALKAGEYTKMPVQSPFGWHVIKVEDVRLKEPPALEDVSAAITNMLMREYYDTLAKEAIEKLGVAYKDEAVGQFMQMGEDELEEE